MSEMVAVFQIGSLGDSIVSIPTLLSLKELVPNCSEYILVSQFDSAMKVSPADVFDMVWPAAQHIQYASSRMPMQQLVTVPALFAKLRYYKPKYCLNLLPADRSAEQIRRDKSFFEWGGIREFLGFEAYPATQFSASSSRSIKDTEAYLRFQRAWGVGAAEKFQEFTRVPLMRPSDEATRRVGEWLSQQRRQPDKRLIAISPYSNYSSKNIPDQVVSELLPELARKADAEIVLVGGKKDFERSAQLLTRPDAGLNACGVFSVQESAALLQACSLAICADSGPMHLAAAIGVPLLVVYSRINAQLARWLPSGQRSTIVYRDVACAGCDSRDCKVAGHPCVELVSAGQLLYSAMNLLNGLPVLEDQLNGSKVLTW